MQHTVNSSQQVQCLPLGCLRTLFVSELFRTCFYVLSGFCNEGMRRHGAAKMLKLLADMDVWKVPQRLWSRTWRPSCEMFSVFTANDPKSLLRHTLQILCIFYGTWVWVEQCAFLFSLFEAFFQRKIQILKQFWILVLRLSEVNWRTCNCEGWTHWCFSSNGKLLVTFSGPLFWRTKYHSFLVWLRNLEVLNAIWTFVENLKKHGIYSFTLFLWKDLAKKIVF